MTDDTKPGAGAPGQAGGAASGPASASDSAPPATAEAAAPKPESVPSAKPAEAEVAAPKPAPAAASSKSTAPEKAAGKPAAAPKPAAAGKPAAAAKPRPKPKPKPPPEPPKGPTDPPPPEGMASPPAVAVVEETLPDAVEAVSYWVGDWTLIVRRERLLEVLELLKTHEAAAFDYCSDVTATDWPPRERRFDLIYCLYSTRLRHRVRVKVRVGEDDAVESVTGLWPAANWLEREVFDQFGVNIVNHPDLRRILMPDEWQGHPQRKDYPLEGPGELLMENPQDWLRVRNLPDEAADTPSGTDAEPAPDTEIE